MNPLNDPEYYSRERVEQRKKQQRQQRRRKDLALLAAIFVLGGGTFILLRQFVGEGSQVTGSAGPSAPTAPSPTSSLEPVTPEALQGATQALLNANLAGDQFGVDLIITRVHDQLGCTIGDAALASVSADAGRRIVRTERRERADQLRQLSRRGLLGFHAEKVMPDGVTVHAVVGWVCP